MGVSRKISSYIASSSWIRKMFEEGLQLKKIHGNDAVLDFSLGNPDVEAPPEVKKALEEILKNYNPKMHGYMPNAGLPETRKILAYKVSKEQGIDVPPENIIVTVGAAGGINIVLKTIIDEGDKVLFPSPYFVEYFFYVENHGGIPVPVETKDDFSIDIDEFDRNIDERTKALIINSPNNPTGVIYDEKSLKELANLVREKSKRYGKPIYIISDEPYRNIVFDGEKVPSIMNIYENTFVVSSFSKELSLAGERIGFVAVHPGIDALKETLEGLILCNRILGFVNAPNIAQRIVNYAIEGKVKVDVYEERRNLIVEILEEAGLETVKPKGGLFIFPKVPIDDLEFCRLLKEELILAVPGRGFGRKNHIRLAFCVDSSIIERLRERIKRVMERVSKYESNSL